MGTDIAKTLQIRPGGFYTVNEVASMLRLERRAVRNLFSTRVIPGAVKVGKSWRILGASLSDFFEEQQANAPEERKRQ